MGPVVAYSSSDENRSFDLKLWSFLEIPSQRMENILSAMRECNTAIAGGPNTELHGKLTPKSQG